jgi:hypothetical protein
VESAARAFGEGRGNVSDEPGTRNPDLLRRSNFLIACRARIFPEQ